MSLLANRFRRVAGATLALTAIASIPIGGYFLLRWVWRHLQNVNPDLGVATIAAVSTVLVTVITVMAGRYYERKRETEAHFRATKIEIYDEFLKELFKLFKSSNSSGNGANALTDFLIEWQRKLVLLGGPEVLRTYLRWKTKLKLGPPDAESIFAMDAFFRALRSDVGQSSTGIERGAFSHLILRHAEVFLAAAKDNPKITLAEVATLEKKLGLE